MLVGKASTFRSDWPYCVTPIRRIKHTSSDSGSKQNYSVRKIKTLCKQRGADKHKMGDKPVLRAEYHCIRRPHNRPFFDEKKKKKKSISKNLFMLEHEDFNQGPFYCPNGIQTSRLSIERSNKNQSEPKLPHTYHIKLRQVVRSKMCFGNVYV